MSINFVKEKCCTSGLSLQLSNRQANPFTTQISYHLPRGPFSQGFPMFVSFVSPTRAKCLARAGPKNVGANKLLPLQTDIL